MSLEVLCRVGEGSKGDRNLNEVTDKLISNAPKLFVEYAARIPPSEQRRGKL